MRVWDAKSLDCATPNKGLECTLASSVRSSSILERHVHLYGNCIIIHAATVFGGTLGITTRGGSMPKFRDFLKSLSPKLEQGNPFIKEFWENSFACIFPSSLCEPPNQEFHDQVDHHMTSKIWCVASRLIGYNFNVTLLSRSGWSSL